MVILGTILLFIFIGIIYMIPVFMGVTVFGSTMLGSRHPFWLAVPYFIFILAVPDTSFGVSVKDLDIAAQYYSRGAGVLGLPFLNFLLFGLFAMVMIGRYFKRTMVVSHNLGWVLRVLLLLIFCNLIVGLLLNYSFEDLIDHRGLRHVVNMVLAFYMFLALFRDEKDFKSFINIFMSVAVLRGLYGTFRYIFKGGDPANFYANFEKVDVKLTFFDVNDSYVATVACFVAAWRLIQLQGQKAFWLKVFYWFIVALEVFIVVFSFRRTAWIGFGLAALLFAYLQKRDLRNLLLLAYVSAGVPMIVAQTLKRMSKATVLAGDGLLARIAPDVFSNSQYGPSNGRIVELQAAFDSIIQYPILGLGIWGSYNGYGILALAFHKDDFTWMHSGILHIALKLGLVGVLLLFLIWWRFGRFLRQSYHSMDKEHQGLMLAFAAGYLFYLPTWLMGTPVVEFRTMQIIGMSMALPYVVYAVAKSKIKRH
jgi:O-Antigen ligase